MMRAKGIQKKEENIRVGNLPVLIGRKNIKNLYLRVKEPDGRVEVSAPLSMETSYIEVFVQGRMEWILQAKEKVLSREQEREKQPVEAPFVEREKRQKLQKTLDLLIAKWEPVMGVHSNGFAIKKMKTRWGSCNVRTGHLNFNYALAEKKPQEIEYVVVHELTHLLEPSHNARFWAIMEYYLPGSRQLRKQLNDREDPQDKEE